MSVFDCNLCPPFPIVSGVEFRHIPGFSGYAAGDDGSIWSSLSRNGRGLSKTWRIKSQVWSGPKGNKYPCCGVVNEAGKKKQVKVCRLVLLAFRGPPPRGTEATHFPSNDRTNNRLDNLAWRTRKQNINDEVQHGTHHFLRTPGGEKHPAAKLTDKDIADIRELGKTKTRREIEAIYGIHYSHVRNILINKVRPPKQESV